jgi:hypothetical protein
MTEIEDDSTPARDAARFRYLSQRVVAIQYGDRVGMAVDTRDLEGVEFPETPTFRELVDAMMTNSVDRTTKGH